MKIQKVGDYMQRKEKSENYIITTTKALKQLAKAADLNNPEVVEFSIAKMKRKIKIIRPDHTQLWIDGDKPVTNTWKSKLVTSYQWYCKVFEIEWKDRPYYKAEPKGIQPPTEEHIRTFIAAERKTLNLKIFI